MPQTPSQSSLHSSFWAVQLESLLSHYGELWNEISFSLVKWFHLLDLGQETHYRCCLWFNLVQYYLYHHNPSKKLLAKSCPRFPRSCILGQEIGKILARSYRWCRILAYTQDATFISWRLKDLARILPISCPRIQDPGNLGLEIAKNFFAVT